MATIAGLTAKEILDSRGAPTLEVSVRTQGGVGTASIPAGASTGRREAAVVPVPQALASIAGELSQALIGKKFDQRSLDEALVALDGTPTKARLGGNTMLGVSLAFARAAADEAGVPFRTYIAGVAGTEQRIPCPMFNVLNGGKHANNNLDIQEFLMVPVGIDATYDCMRAGGACTAALKDILSERRLSTFMGDEGGFAPALQGDEEALDLLVQARERAGYTPQQVRLSLDAAASSSTTHHDEAWWLALIKKYDLLSLEDPYPEDNTADFAALQRQTPAVIVGDDLTTTNAASIAAAAAAGAIKGVILKPNQAGTLSETVDAAAAARKAGLVCIASHRSGETMDDWIVDVAVGLGCEYLKAGAPTRPERLVKYNKLITIASAGF